MTPSSRNLKLFGETLLGPLTASYYSWLGVKLAERNIKQLIFPAREGHFLQHWFSVLQKFGLWGDVANTYLVTSRVGLYRTCLHDPELLPLALHKSFGGTLRKLLIGRLGLDLREVLELGLGDSNLEMRIDLPADNDYVVSLLSRRLDRIRPALVASQDIYRNYLNTLGLPHDGRVGFVDIGFSGTIQTLLDKIYGLRSVGFYFATVDPHSAGEDAPDMHSCFVRASRFGENVALIDRSLFLESVLTAPVGQFRQMKFIGGQFTNVYGAPSKTQESFYILDQIAAGVSDYLSQEAVLKSILDGSAIARAESINAFYDHFTADPSVRRHPLMDLFEIDDDVSGFGRIAPNRFLQF